MGRGCFTRKFLICINVYSSTAVRLKTCFNVAIFFRDVPSKRLSIHNRSLSIQGYSLIQGIRCSKVRIGKQSWWLCEGWGGCWSSFRQAKSVALMVRGKLFCISGFQVSVKRRSQRSLLRVFLFLSKRLLSEE